MTTRKEVRSLQAPELLALRRAMMEFQAKSVADHDGYIYIAGYHGIPQHLCEHKNLLFLAWHRIYISTFEKALQKIDASVALPYWDWASPDSLTQGMAPAHTDSQFTDSDGLDKANPLKAAPIEDSSRNTVRNTNPSMHLLQTAAASLRLAYNQPTFALFTGGIIGPHDSVHVWVGGIGEDMLTTDRAAYDPVFWSHHANVDYQWAKWQVLHPGISTDPATLNTQLNGFNGITVQKVWDISSELLNYTYDGLSTESTLSATLSRVKGINRTINEAPPAIVQIAGIQRSGSSFIVDMFLTKKDTKEEAFAGSFGIFGSLMPMHMGHHGMTSDQYIDVTSALQKLGVPKTSVDIKLSGMNVKGEVVNQKSLPIGTVSFL